MLEINELLKATQGRLISGPSQGRVGGISIDSRTIQPNDFFIAIKGTRFDGHNFITEVLRKGAKAVISQSPFRSLAFARGSLRSHVRRSQALVSFIWVKDTTRALGDIARFHRERFDIPIIAVTGSNGKTTTKEMLSWVLSKKFKVLKNIGTKNNQIGLPQALLNLNSSFDLAVLEIGTNHPGEVEYLARIAQPNIGIITNIAPSHLEYFKDLKGVLKEKNALIKNLKEPGIAILNRDDSLLRKKACGDRGRNPIIFGFGIRNKADFIASDIKVLNNKVEFSVNCGHAHMGRVYKKYRFTPLDGRSKIDESRHLTGFTLKTLGYYNIYNALAACAVARIFGLDYKDIASRLATFDFLKNRLKLIELNKIRFINDSYNSNPFSLKQALDALDSFQVKGRKIFVMGDMLELGKQEESFHRSISPKIARTCDVFVAVGRLSKFTARQLDLSGFGSKKIFSCESAKDAGRILFGRICVNPDDIVLVKGSRAMMMEEVFPT